MKILVCRLSSLGDVLLTTPALRLLRRKFPDAQIDFLVKEEFADVLRSNPHITHLLQFSANDIISVLQFRFFLQRKKYDVVIDLHNSLRTRVLRFLLAPKVFVVKKNIFKRMLLVIFKLNLYSSIVSVPEKYINTLASLGITNDNGGLDLFYDESVLSAFNKKKTDWRIAQTEFTILFSPTAKHATKMWLPEYFIALGKKLAKEHHAKIYIVGAPNEKEYCERIAVEINNSCADAAINTAGKISLLETAALMEQCSAVVTNDSAMLHFASALKKNVVAVFGSTVKEFGFLPYRTNFRIVQNENLRCRPCSHIGKNVCPEQHFRCIKDISVQHVYESLRELLQPHT
ncbi:MAG: glycosyltransferase family 9 protein [Bacteroidota bacterium]